MQEYQQNFSIAKRIGANHGEEGCRKIREEDQSRGSSVLLGRHYDDSESFGYLPVSRLKTDFTDCAILQHKMKVPLLISKMKAHKIKDDYILHFSIFLPNRNCYYYNAQKHQQQQKSNLKLVPPTPVTYSRCTSSSPFKFRPSIQYLLSTLHHFLR